MLWSTYYQVLQDFQIRNQTVLSQCLKMLLHLEIVEHWERKGLPSPPLNPFLHLHRVEHWERKGIPPPSLDPFLQLTKRRHVRQNSRW